MSFPIIATAFAFAEIIPAIGKILGSGVAAKPDQKSVSGGILLKTEKIAEEILSFARQLTKTDDPVQSLGILKNSPELFLKFQDCVASLEREHIAAEVNDRISARERDFKMLSLGRSNRRADIMVIAAATGLVLCLVSLCGFREHLSGEAIGIISTVAGVFGACLKDAFSFEFGRSRPDKEDVFKSLTSPVVAKPIAR